MGELERVPVAARDELMAPYRRPFAHLLVATWHEQLQFRVAPYVAGGLLAASLVALAAGAAEVALLLGLGATAAACVVLAWVVPLVLVVRRLTRAWSGASELGDVRARRPQAGSEDPAVAHPEYAVTVDDNGRLVTWRFRPLRAGERPRADELEVPGRPRYAAAPVDDTPYDLTDTARASEQLVAAQAAAAQREQDGAAAAQQALALDGDARALAEEAASTAAALRHATGQAPRRR